MEKLIKKFLNLILILAIYIFVSYGYLLNFENKIYCYASIDDNFEPDSVLVVLNESASFNENEYTIMDFNEINCIDVTDLTAVSTESITNNEEAYLVNKEKYRRVLKLTLNEVSKENVLNTINILIKREDVLYAGPNYKLSLSSSSLNDTYYSSQWAIENIDLSQTWNYSLGSDNIYVGIIDSGIDGLHPDLSSKIIGGLCRDFQSENEVSISCPLDLNGHGTHVAGIIGAISDNNLGVSGVNRNVKLVSLCVCDITGQTNVSSIANAVGFAQRHNIKILNFSISSEKQTINTEMDFAFKSIIDSYDGLFVAAVGNDGINIDGNETTYPSKCDSENMITVGALDDKNEICSFSNYGLTSVDIYAPGQDILNTYPADICEENIIFNDGTKLCELRASLRSYLSNVVAEQNITWDDVINSFEYNFEQTPSEYKSSHHLSQGYHYMDGTSMAAPHVTGVAALLLSMNPNLTVEQIKTAIINGAESITITIPNGTTQTVKKLNAYNAVKYVLENYLDYPSYTINNSSTDINISKTIYEDASYFNELNGFYELNFGSTKDYCFTISSTNGLEVNLYNSNFEEVAITDLNSSINVFKFNKSFNVGTYYLQVKYNNEELNGTITINGHAHSYTMQYYNYKWHKLTCECGHTSGSNLVHSILQSSIVDDRYAPCIGCGHMLDLNTDMPIIRGQSINNSVMVSNNGSYILPSGIIVLVDEDLELYLNGTLIFYNRNELFMTE